MIKFVPAFFLLIVWANQAFALPPAREDYPHRPHSDWLSGPEMQRDGFGPLSLPVPARSPEDQFDAPWKVILVLVDFPGKAGPANPEYYADMLFGKHSGDASGAPYKNQSMADFYESMSGGALTLEKPLVYGWWRAPEDYSYYASYSGSGDARGCHGLGQLMNGTQSGAVELMNWVVDKLVAEGVDLKQYDNDGDGRLDGLFVVHAGAGGEQTWPEDRNPCLKDSNGVTTQGGDIWSHQFRIAYDIPVVDNGVPKTKTFFIEYLIGPARSASSHSSNGLSAMGVWAHEFGHMLHLPDLYAEVGYGYGVGCWDLMGYAITSCSADFYGEDPGEDPNEMSVWTRRELGWSAPLEVEENVCNRRVDPVQFGGETFKVTPDPEQPADYFLVEFRGEVGLDKDLLSDSSVENKNRVCVWHVDDAKFGLGSDLPNERQCFPNDNRAECKTSHYGLAVVEYDQNESLAWGAQWIEAGDCMGPNSEMSTDDNQGMKTWPGKGDWSVRTGSLAAQGSISIIVDPTDEPVKPEFTSRPPSAERGSTWKYQPKLKEDSGLPQWQLTEYPAGMTIDTDTGLISWKVPVGFSKDRVSVTVAVENCGGGNEQKFSLAVFDPEVRGCACSTTGSLPRADDMLPFALLAIALRLRRTVHAKRNNH
jgi:M6 family metalloprotease-like protein